MKKKVLRHFGLPMKTAEAFAPAKINLTLHVTGQRQDGYHLLDSLVAFATVGDTVSVSAADQLGLRIIGPEAAALQSEPDNLILRAARVLDAEGSAEIVLEKNLPVSSGIGGGSTDAAAALRALSALWDVPLPASDELLRLGADVPVCITNDVQRMSGIGETIAPVPHVPKAGIVLINPRHAVSTPEIFKALACKANPPMEATLPKWGGFADFCIWLRQQRNDLQGAAEQRLPVIRAMCDLLHQNGAGVARMSGSGATCFGLFPTGQAARDAADACRAVHPDWWIEAGTLLV